MAFGVSREELEAWKRKVLAGEIAFLTHYWYETRFPEFRTITKVGCANLQKLKAWCESHHLNPRYIHYRDRYPHFDLIGSRQKEILLEEGHRDQVERFQLQ
ncbi:hypothetical protein DUZ99_17555 [Xylanibacillus composti]|uniref:YneQ n=1 Tax=Xylanibacillus composti TaxID=1572762 RepID=A0A8J4H0A6_9BACL|nr:hypothetical protein [Xylanibacillus composti]MDT9726787.1 hypothetical protein [Xylanibacillus composti]GIQ67231.1 hypothetical protein XYCOK13_00550 [Xylanibacillus composti]